MNKNILIVAIVIISLLIIFLLFQIPGKRAQVDDFAICLQRNNVVIYGTDCPPCKNLLNEFKDVENIDLIYIDCDKIENTSKCRDEKKTGNIPETQINGEVFDNYTIKELSEKTGCAIN
jgi:hypothetical protein